MKVQKIIALIIIGSTALLATSFNLSRASVIQEKKDQISIVKQSIDKLNVKMETAVEEYNQFQSNLGIVKQKLHKNRLSLSRTKTEINLKRQILSKRVIAIYKEGPLSTIKIFLGANNFRELLEGFFFVNRVIKNDNSLIKEFEGQKKELEQINNELILRKVQQEILVNKVALKKLEVKNTISQKYSLLKSVQVDLAVLQAEERARIKRIREEALRKLAQYKPPTPNYNGDNTAPKSDVVEIAKKYLGVRYTWGGTSPETGFDCSGFVWYVYNQVGVTLPRTSRQQYYSLSSKGRLVSEENLAPGDLVFYGRSTVTDVKMYMGAGYVIGANGGQFTPGEVRILALHYRADFYASGRP